MATIKVTLNSLAIIPRVGTTIKDRTSKPRGVQRLFLNIKFGSKFNNPILFYTSL